MFENKNKGKFIGFIKKQGFYIVLILCVLAAGTISYFAINAPAPETSQEQGQDVQKQEAPGLQEEMEARKSPSPSPSPMVSPSSTATVTPSPSPSGKKTTQSKAMLTLPLKGEIVKTFSGETLVFNATLNMWMTHNGIDISAAENTEVVAALPGTVKKAENDATKGQIVTIQHTGDQTTIYVGLAEVNVKEGAKVNAGQKIGVAGTPGFEAAEGPHLHFEYLLKGKYTDPVPNIQGVDNK